MKFSTFESLKDDIEKLENHLKENYPDVPQNVNKVWLSKFLKACDLNIDDSAKLLKLNLEMRKGLGEIFRDREYTDEAIVKSRNVL